MAERILFLFSNTLNIQNSNYEGKETAQIIPGTGDPSLTPFGTVFTPLDKTHYPDKDPKEIKES